MNINPIDHIRDMIDLNNTVIPSDFNDLELQFRDYRNMPIDPDEIESTDEIKYIMFHSQHGVRTCVSIGSSAYCNMCDSHECRHVSRATDAIAALSE